MHEVGRNQLDGSLDLVKENDCAADFAATAVARARRLFGYLRSRQDDRFVGIEAGQKNNGHIPLTLDFQIGSDTSA